MSALSDAERVVITLALLIIFALGIFFLRRLTDAERRLANAERRLTNAERQFVSERKRDPIGFLHFSPA
jgi:flagellar biogenesis protein FliO